MHSSSFSSLSAPLTLGVLPLFMQAPHAAHNISDLARRGYYDGTSFHRIIKGFMVQGGDPTGTGRGGTSIYGERFRDEITPELKHTGAGVVSMANAGPNTNGSQFFVILAPCPWLDGKHTVLGRVSDGMGVIQRMGIVQTDANDRPMQEIKIIRSYPVSRIGDQETLLRDCKF